MPTCLSLSCRPERAVLALLLLALALLAAQPARADVLSVRIAGNGDPSRVTVWLSAPVAAEAFQAVSATGAPQVRLHLPSARTAVEEVLVPEGTGVRRVHADAAGLVFELERPMMIVRQLTLPPAGTEKRDRVIVDLSAVAPARFAAAVARDSGPLARRMEAARTAPASPVPVAASAENAPATLTAFPLHPVSEARYTLVIDPGHGGRDPGAISASGREEADVVLAAAKTLKALLEADTRYEVRLTRAEDTFIELEDRVSKARAWGADLFISLHADAAGSPDVRGASVYTLSARGERRVDREAARHDWHMPIEDGTSADVSLILADLIKRETKTRSGEFAALLIPELAAAGPVLRNTHRNAGFFVLLAPDVPAVLLEIGFLTNPDDDRRLASEAGRRAAMEAVARAINRYFDQQDLRLAAN